jgi:acetylornithine deacetylase
MMQASNGIEDLKDDAIALLKELIATPSFSREEEQTAGLITRFLGLRRIEHARIANNVYAFNGGFDPSKPTVLLNSHHDTVKPATGWVRDPFQANEEDGRLYGLGSNDAGASLVALIAAFLHFHDREGLPWNLALAATAEEEVSGPNGVEYLLNSTHFNEALQGSRILGAVVGEPTGMQMAVAEMGLMVVDAMAAGRSGHAARNEGDNAILHAMEDIRWVHTHRFGKVSDLLGPNKATVTVIETENKAHNVVPDRCRFTVDVRVNDTYTFEEVLAEMQANMRSTLKPRSTRLRPTRIADDHPLVRAGLSMGRTSYGSPTTSDKALMPFPALKMGPGDSARSHTPDEYILLSELREAVGLYIGLLEKAMDLDASTTAR